MKKIIKRITATILILVVAFFIFFFWASSATINDSDYKKITTYAEESEKNQDSIFSIITYNIGYLSGMTNNLPIAKPKSLFDNNLENVIIETQKINPDIIAFQEIDFDASRSYNINQHEEIAKIEFTNGATTVNWDKRYLPFPYWPIETQFGKVLSGQSVLSKFPIIEQDRIVLQRVANASFFRDAFYLDRLAQVLKVKILEKEVIVINVHLEAFDANTRKKQFKEIQILLNQYKEDFPVLLVGDFNSEARDKESGIQQLLNDTSLGVAAFTKENPSNTFSSRNPKRRLDYIFYNKKFIREVSSKVLLSYGEASDHLPVYMQFSLK